MASILAPDKTAIIPLDSAEVHQDRIRAGVSRGGFEWPLPSFAPYPVTRMVCRPARGRPYWHASAFDRVLGRSLVVHLGRVERLTPELLDRKAAELAAKLRDYLPSIPRHVECPLCGR